MGESPTDPSERLYSRVSIPLLVVAVMVLLAGIVMLLVTGGNDAPVEARGDLTYLEGSAPRPSWQGQGQLAASIADINAADVHAEGSVLLFVSEVVGPLPQRLKSSLLEFRWDISAGDVPSWTLAVTIDNDAQASLFSDQGYGVATVDDTLPGELTIAGEMVTVRVDTSRIGDFPSTFAWSVATTLRAFRDETDSPRVEDRFPDEGTESFEG